MKNTKLNNRIIFRNFEEFYLIMTNYYNGICVNYDSSEARLRVLNEYLESIGKPPVDKLAKITSKMKPFLKQMLLKMDGNNKYARKHNPTFDFTYNDCVSLLDIDVVRRFYPFRAVDKLKQMNSDFTYNQYDDRVISNIKDVSVIVRNVDGAKRLIKTIVGSKGREDMMKKFLKFTKTQMDKYDDIKYDISQIHYLDGANNKLMNILYIFKRTMILNKFNNKYLVSNHKKGGDVVDFVHKSITVNGKCIRGYVFMINNILPGYVAPKRNKKSKDISDDKLTHTITSMTQMVSGMVGKDISVRELEGMIKRYSKVVG